MSLKLSLIFLPILFIEHRLNPEEKRQSNRQATFILLRGLSSWKLLQLWACDWRLHVIDLMEGNLEEPIYLLCQSEWRTLISAVSLIRIITFVVSPQAIYGQRRQIMKVLLLLVCLKRYHYLSRRFGCMRNSFDSRCNWSWMKQLASRMISLNLWRY